MTCSGVVKGNTIQLDEPLPFPDGQVVSVKVEAEPRRGSAAAILAALDRGPRVTEEDVAALEQAIEEGKLPVRDDLFGADPE